ncbi:MAG TPA: hypothetical protein VFO40_27300 [Chthoniobacterales bacterium]|nr:hypothetical protein [Chthoniobacterales bacterium]
MIVHPFLFFAGTILLILALLVSKGSARRRVDDSEVFRHETQGPDKWDSLSLELGAQIFSSKDMDFVRRSSSTEFARAFREERTALALAWLDQVRNEMGCSMRQHTKAARVSTGLRTADELKLALEFALFQVSNRLLYCAVWLYGPLAAGQLVRFSGRLTTELRSLLQNFPMAHSVTVEILKDDSQRSTIS